MIVCSKFRKQLERAWLDDQKASEVTKEIKKTENALFHWRKLIRAVMLGERLKERYL